MTILKRKSKKKDISRLFKKAMAKPGVDTRKFCGVIHLREDPLKIQKRLRDEWEKLLIYSNTIH
jgi:hypothetical protein